MKYWLSLFFLLAQAASFGFINLSNSSVDFGLTEFQQTKSVDIKVTSTLSVSQELWVNPVAEVFTSSLNRFTLKPGADTTITLQFTPNHNVEFTSQAFIVSNKATYWKVVELAGNCELDGYYASTNNLYGKDLVDELKRIISAGYKNLGYTGARDAMYSSIDNVNGKVECVYTGRTATFNSRSGANSNQFNCEHTFPQSLYNKNEPERADIHHLFPTDVTANSRRANYPFGEVSSSTWSSGGSKLGSSRFEPRDQQKGRSARALLYFLLRYTDYSSFVKNHKGVLIDWHFTYLPEKVELDRNDAIFQVQKNRNPFVDHPEFIQRIYPWAIDNFFDWQSGMKHVPLMGSAFGAHLFVKDKTHEVMVSNTSMMFDVTVQAFDNQGNGLSVDESPVALKPGEYTKINVGFESAFTTATVPIHATATDLPRESQNIVYTYAPSELNTNPLASVMASIYPNPASQSVQVSVTAPIEKVQMFTTTGRVFDLTDTLNSLNEYQIPQLPNGIYFVVVHTNDGEVRKRLMIHQQ